jgi:hypothetical protein
LADGRDKAREEQRQATKAEREAIPIQQAYEETPKPAQMTLVEYRYVDESSTPRILQNRISIEFFSMGAAFALSNSYGYTYYYSNVAQHVSESGSGNFGVSLYGAVDLKYLEIYLKLAYMGDDANEADGAALLKYPFVFNAVPVKVTPILGYGDILVVNDVIVESPGLTLGGRIDFGISRISYLRSEYLHFVYFDGSMGMSLKAGGGLDIAWGKKKKAFLRTELLYNWLSLYSRKYKVSDEYGEYEQRVNGKAALHYVDIRVGIGYKWGGVKKIPIEFQGVMVK